MAVKKKTALSDLIFEIFEQNYDAVIIFRLEDLHCCYLNPPAVRMFQASCSDRDGGTISELFSVKKEFDLFLAGVTDSGADDFFISHFKFSNRRGTKIFCGIKGKRINIGSSRYIYCTFRDIQEKVLKEAKESEMLARLIHANKISSLGTMALGMAHQINNPNNIIMANNQMFADIFADMIRVIRHSSSQTAAYLFGGLDANEVERVVPEMIKASIDSSKRIKSILERLKIFSVPRGRELQKQPISINSTIQETIDVMQKEITEHSENFRFIPHSDLPDIVANQQQMQQVIINLLQNSLNALKSKKQAVEIATALSETEGEVVVRITDEGCGIPDEIIEQVTDPFFTTRHKSSSSGLGLYICYSIIRGHNGRMDISSAKNEGTTVTVYLPVSEKSEQ